MLWWNACCVSTEGCEIYTIMLEQRQEIVIYYLLVSDFAEKIAN